MPAFLLRLVRHTVWEPGAIPAHERKYAVPLKRYALPAIDIVFIVAGFYAVRSGIPSLDELLPDTISDVIAYVFVACAIAALIGVLYVRAWLLELIAKIAIVGVLGTYFLALRTLAMDGDPNRDFVSAIVLAGIVLPSLRLWILGIELRDRREVRQ